MPIIFGESSRGCFYKYSFSGTASQGAMLSLPGKDEIPSAALPGVIITGVSSGQRESVSHLKCFGGAIYTFVFGADPGDLSVEFLAFLSQKSNEASAGKGTFASVLDCYARNRISESKALATLSLAGGSISAQVISLQGSTANTESGIQSFILGLKTTVVQGVK